MKREIALEEHMSLSKEPAFPLSLLSIGQMGQPPNGVLYM
jgi:hypothetical protein